MQQFSPLFKKYSRLNFLNRAIWLKNKRVEHKDLFSSQVALSSSHLLNHHACDNLKKSIAKKHTKARFTRINEEDKKHFSSSTGVLYVSLGNHYCYNEYLKASLDLIDTHSFKLLKVVLCDTLQLRTQTFLQPQLSVYNIYNQLLQEGSQWIIDHAHLFKNMKNTPVFFVKWSDQMLSPTFKSSLAKIKDDYKCDPDYQAAIKSTIQTFLARQKNLVISNDAMQLSEAYILEEIAEFAMAQHESDYHIFINQREEALKATAKKYASYDGKLKELAIRFKTTYNHADAFFEDNHYDKGYLPSISFR